MMPGCKEPGEQPRNKATVKVIFLSYIKTCQMTTIRRRTKDFTALFAHVTNEIIKFMSG